MNIFPLSSQQKGLWFVQKMAQDNCVYNLVFAARILSNVQVEALQRAFNMIMARHPALRTCFRNSTSGLEQYVAENITADFQHINACLWDDNMLRERALEDTRRPFQLDNPPFLRVRLYEHRKENWILTLTAHHITVDFWSLAVILDELKHLYGTSIETLQKLAIPQTNYMAYVQNQLEMLSSPQGANSLAYWKNRLAGRLPVLELPFDYPRPPIQSFNGRSIGFQLDKEVSEGLKNLAKSNGVTLYMLVLATFQIFLHRYSGESDILVGTYVSDRPRSLKLEHVVGNFINTVVMRSKLDGSVSFLEFLKQVRTSVIEDIRHQRYPFPLLVEKLQLQHDPSVPPVFQAAFAWERLPHFEKLADFFALEGGKKTVQFGSLLIEPFPLPQQEGQVDLFLEMGGESEGKLFGTLKYNCDLFLPITISAMITHFKTLLESIVADPHGSIGYLPLQTQTEIQRLVQQGTGSIIQYPDVHTSTLIEEQVRHTPESIALIFETQKLTFTEVNTRAEQLADYLSHKGLTPGKYVGICVERSPEMIIAVLAVLKVGCAYVPLDPDFPAERLTFMLEDCQAALLVTQETLLLALFSNYRNPVICLDREQTHIKNAATRQSIQLPNNAAECAYIIYTSGSTGQPKGVQISHRALINLLYYVYEQEPGVKAEDVIFGVSSFSFDLSVFDIFIPFITGACLVLASREAIRDGRMLAQALDKSGATVMQTTATTWQMLLNSGWQGNSKLKVFSSGEVLPRELASALLERCGSVWALYGPTETTIWCTGSRVYSKIEKITIGHPMANTRLYVLDSYKQPVPMGVAGELYIGGDGLAIGYLNRSALNAERFIPNPIPGTPNTRLYKTGDRVRYPAEGNHLEYLERVDSQVKLRGYRIELGEIETLLKQQAQIKDAVVILREDVPGDQRLVAYIINVSSHTDTVDIATLRTSLSKALPDYMMPSAFVFLEVFPLTPNNKIDRRALPPPIKNFSERDLVAPRDSVEIRLVCIWEELLNTHPIGVHDNFFEIGGHSLLAVQLMAKIQQEWQLELPVSTLMRLPTVEALANIIRNDEKIACESLLVPLNTRKNKHSLFLIHPFGGTVFCYLALVRHLEAEHSVYAVQSPGVYKADAVEISIEDIAAQYIQVIQEQQPQGPYYLGGWCFGGVLAFEIAHQLLQAGEFISMVALMDSRAPIPENQPDDGDDATLLSWFARDLAVPYNKTLIIPPEELRALNPDKMFEHVLDRAKVIQVVPQNANCELLRRYFEIYIAHGMALQTFFPEQFKLPLVLFRAINETENYGPTLGWEKLCSHQLEIVDVPGTHNSIMYEPQVQILAERLGNYLQGHIT